MLPTVAILSILLGPQARLVVFLCFITLTLFAFTASLSAFFLKLNTFFLSLALVIKSISNSLFHLPLLSEFLFFSRMLPLLLLVD